MDNNERYITGKIKDHREDVDLDGLWAGVSPHIPKKKQKRRGVFWLLGLCMLIAFFIFSWMSSSENDTESGKWAQRTIQNDRDEIASRGEENRTVTMELNAEESSRNETLSVEPVDKADEVSKEVAVHAPVTNQRRKAISNYTSSFESKLQKKNGKDTGLMVSNSIQKKSRANGEEVNVNSMEDTSQEIVDNALLEGPREKGNARLMYSLQSLKLLSMAPEYGGEEVAIDLPEIIRPSFASKAINGKWTIYVRGGAALGQRLLTSRTVELGLERDRRNEIASMLGAWSIEGGFGLKLRPKLTLQTGISYQQIHEKTEFETDYLVDYETMANNVIHKQDGSMDTEPQAQKGQGIRHTEEVRYNQLRTLRIPLRLQYEIVDLDGIKIDVGGMFAYSLNQDYVGFTSLSATSERYDLGLDPEGKFRSKGALAYGLSLMGRIHLSRMIDFSFGFEYQRATKINSEIYLIDQQYNLFSITSGFSRRF